MLCSNAFSEHEPCSVAVARNALKKLSGLRVITVHVLLPFKKISTTPVCILGYEVANLGHSAQNLSEHHVYVAEAWRASGIEASIAEPSIGIHISETRQMWLAIRIHISETRQMRLDAAPLAVQSPVAPLVVSVCGCALCSIASTRPCVVIISVLCSYKCE